MLIESKLPRRQQPAVQERENKIRMLQLKSQSNLRLFYMQQQGTVLLFYSLLEVLKSVIECIQKRMKDPECS